MKVWITKYALSLGVFTVDAKTYDDSPGMVSYKASESHFTQFAHGNDWHMTKEAAEKRVEQMRQKKIASLKQQIAKLEAMKFEVEP